MLLKINENLIINTDYIVSIQPTDVSVIVMCNPKKRNEIWENKYPWTINLIDSSQCFIDENTYNYLRETKINEPKL